MKLKYLLISFMTAAAATAGAVTVNVGSPGLLEATVGAAAASMTDLTLTGTVNATDLHYISTSMPALVSLDLSAVSIAADDNSRLATNHATYPAATLPAYVLAGAKFSRIVLPSNLKAIGSGALMSTPVTTVTIPASVTSIGAGAFADCTALKEITIPSTVTTVGSHTFSGCTALEKVTFGPTAVPSSAFSDCKNLTLFSGDVTEIGASAFSGCTALASFPFSSKLTSIGESAFVKSGLTRVDATATALRAIGAYAFAHCQRLTSVSLPSTVKEIGAGAFFDDTSVTNLAFPPSVTTVSDFVLKGASSLNNGFRLLPEGVDSIGRYALAGMTGLQQLTVPSTVSHISDNAMQQLTAVHEIDARGLRTVPSLGNDVWSGVEQNHVTLYVDPSMENSFTSSPQWNEFAIVTAGTSTGIEADAMTADSVNASLEGDLLRITSEGAPIEAVGVYDITGRMLEFRGAVGSQAVVVNLTDRQERVIVVTIRLEDSDMIRSFKLAR